MELFPIEAGVSEILRRCRVGGTRQVGTNDTGYESRAVIPRGDWRPLTTSQAKQLRGATDARRMVEIVRLPSEVFAAIIGAGQGRADIPVLPSTDATYRGAMTCTGDTLTTTVNPENDGLRIGLHLDNWDQQTCANRLDSRRRLMVNLGPAPRYLLIGEFDATWICRELYPGDHADRYPHTDDVAEFVARWSMECLRIRIDPGEGYVAPTEVLVHDGSTTGITGRSTAAFWLGHLPQGVLPSAL
ncbi:hypothetical protein ACFP3U_15835 [Kitasatospora misakiensis]|uniref:Uncharacterized protein n=1 Tax=Kitasatospora misakiensis TaxID=67330 RepID=A0ABW0X7H5_9ACTN